MGRTLHLVICLVLSVLLTVVAYAWSEHATRAARMDSGLVLARQVAVQLDALALHAREKGISDPIGWAVGILTQGEEPRTVRVSKIEATPSMETEETFGFDRSSGVFDYSKLLVPEQGRGVRIQIQSGYVGFLGVRTRAKNDLLLALLLGLLHASIYFSSVSIFGLSGEKRVKRIITDWVGQARVVLNQFAAHIRELLRGEQMLMKSAADCHALLQSVEAKMHDQLRDFQEVQRVQWDQAQALKRSETLTLSAVIEASRLGPGGKRLAEINEELHRLVLKKQEMAQVGGEGLEAAAQSMEEWTEEVHKASEMMVTIFGATKVIGEQLKGTTDSVMDQAKLMKALNEQLSKGLRVELKSDSKPSSSGQDSGTA